MADMKGGITFNGEGNNNRGSRFYSRVIHYPERGISGVTIGRGYDMGSRTTQEIYSDLTRAGVTPAQAQAISQAARLRGDSARQFVRENRELIGEITEQQQVKLFNHIYPVYEQRARRTYETRTANVAERTAWHDLHPAIRDVVVDIVYQGFQGSRTMLNASSNDIDVLINFINTNDELRRYEKNRGRARYLEANR